LDRHFSRTEHPYTICVASASLAIIKIGWIYFLRYANLKSVEASIFECKVYLSQSKVYESFAGISKGTRKTIGQ